ncbi:DUF6434 domain-containing protein [Friedmanniella luteola]|nr:DUF6434 domain-containing protein [Friedmanniella luteola]
MTESRPPLTDELSGPELLRWYWTRAELLRFARASGLDASGDKQALTAKVAAHLDGAPAPRAAPRRPPPPPPLPEPLSPDTVIPAGQRCTQQLRRHLTAVVGPSFRFDAAMRDFVAGGAGRTLGAAADHWSRTRGRPRPAIGAQFELNRFLRDWHHDHPAGTRAEALEAWQVRRALPVEAWTAPRP